MNKEIKDRLDKLENEVKESKNEIHSLKSSVSLTIERGIRKLLSRFTRKQLLLGSVIALFSISIIGIAGTVTKTYTFSSGDVVSASKINTNFDTLFTLVNGNLDDNNISGISGSKITSGTVAAARLDNMSGSKITSGTVAAARIDNLDGSKITSGTVAAARIDNLDGSKITSGTIAAARIDNLDGSKITSGTIAAARIDNLSASMITSGTLSGDRLDNISDSIIYGKTIVFYVTTTLYNGNLGGRSGADAKCVLAKKNWLLTMGKTNVRAFMSISATDEIRDMVSNYTVPSTAPIISPLGTTISDNISDFLDGDISKMISKHFIKDSIAQYAYTGSTSSGSLNLYHCANWTAASGNNGMKGNFYSPSLYLDAGSAPSCNESHPITCIAF
jgi:hypothetical protein